MHAQLSRYWQLASRVMSTKIVVLLIMPVAATESRCANRVQHAAQDAQITLPFETWETVNLFYSCEHPGETSPMCRRVQGLAKARQQTALRRLSKIDPNGTLVASLWNNGLESSVFGLDLRLLQKMRSPLVMDTETRQLVDAVVHGGLKSPLVRNLWEQDWGTSIRRPACSFSPNNQSISHLAALERDGWTRIDDYGLDMKALSTQVSKALASTPPSTGDKAAPIKTSQATLPALEPLLRNKTIAKLISDYFGGPARYDGHTILQLLPSATAKTYASYQWHHDRCGRRLKLWVYVHDIPDLSYHPTLVARGTQGNLYYSLDAGALSILSRYAGDYIESRHTIDAMTGVVGGGFIFDTNSIHSAAESPGSEQTRTAIILEFHPHHKIGALKKAGLSNPCPSNPKLAAQNGWLQGIPGYQLYPLDK